VVSFEGAAKVKSVEGSAGLVVWELPGWKPVHAEGIQLADVERVAEGDLDDLDDNYVLVNHDKENVDADGSHLRALNQQQLEVRHVASDDALTLLYGDPRIARYDDIRRTEHVAHIPDYRETCLDTWLHSRMRTTT
jgi:hypothetical protein